ncbi:unnamed protein product [Rhizoctonia solani]|uniref:Uncharacterized protein n=1 Tax=Rhizoctonia solani TaxID=456999 RepID=A0A8H3BCQ4_9AGAM|nr:unnamed protein product [Rhizoctonia solani]
MFGKLIRLYSIPCADYLKALSAPPNGGNHTPEFTAAARTQESHERAMAMSKGLAALGLCALLDEAFLKPVKNDFERRRLA